MGTVETEEEIEMLRIEIEHLNRELGEYAAAAQRLAIEKAELRRALEFYANPEVYRPNQHGPAFDRPDLSWRARAALDA